MADFDGNIAPVGAWADVPHLSTSAQLLGGTGGALNAQAVALAARTEKLKTDVDALVGSDSTLATTFFFL